MSQPVTHNVCIFVPLKASLSTSLMPFLLSRLSRGREAKLQTSSCATEKCDNKPVLTISRLFCQDASSLFCFSLLRESIGTFKAVDERIHRRRIFLNVLSVTRLQVASRWLAMHCSCRFRDFQSEVLHIHLAKLQAKCRP